MPIYRVPIVVSSAGGGDDRGALRDGTTVQHGNQAASTSQQHRPTSIQVHVLPPRAASMSRVHAWKR